MSDGTNSKKNLTMMDEGIKIVYNIILLAILGILTWSVTETNATSKKIIELQGAVEVTNVHLEYLRETIAEVPKAEDVQRIQGRVESLETRVTALEGWAIVEQRDKKRK